MWPDRRLTDLLEIEHPLVLAPMAGFGTVELAAAVCSAGGLGSIGCGPVPPSAAAKTIAELRALTNKPINVNFFSHAPAKADAGRERVLVRSAVSLLSRTRDRRPNHHQLASTSRRSATTCARWSRTPARTW